MALWTTVLSFFTRGGKRKFVLWAALIASIVYYLRHVQRVRLAKARMRLSAARRRWQSAMADVSLIRELQALGMRSGGQWVSLAHGKTHYIYRDEGSGPVVLLFHGFGVFSFVWNDVMNSLVEAGYRPLALDFFGFGFSEAPEGVSFNADLFITQAHELLGCLGIREVILVGHSMGGLLSAVFAARYPDLVRKLVLISPAGTRVRNPFRNSLTLSLVHAGARLAQLPALGPLLIRASIAILQHQTTASLSLSNKRNMSFSALQEAGTRLNRVDGDSTRGVGSRFVSMLDLTIKGIVFQDTHNERFTSVLSEVLRNLDMFGDWRDVFTAVGRNSHPTLVIWGELDEFIPAANAAKYLRPAIPSGQFETLADADHYVYMNRPEEFNRILLEFLGKE